MTPDRILAIPSEKPTDPILDLQRDKDNVEFERFINIHAGCEGYQYAEPIATCSGPTHRKVSSAPRPVGYIYK